MMGWKYNETMMKSYLTEHAEDIGRFWAEVFKHSPKFYEDFMRGFLEELNKPKKD